MDAIAAVIQGQTFYSEDYMQNYDTVILLSVREEEMLGYLLHGHTYADIATRMNIHKSTVQSYVERLFVKFGVKTKKQLIEITKKKYS